MRVLIVDDEPLARQGIRRELDRLPGIVCVGECGSRDDAVAAIVERVPDVALLDVQLGRATAFEIIEEIGADRMPLVVFVTAYDKHALKAFEVHAIDYVLKPVDPDRLREALDRAASTLNLKRVASLGDRLEALLAEHGRSLPEAEPAPVASAARLVARQGEHLVFVEPECIDWVEGSGNYVKLHCGAREFIMRSTVERLEQRLAPGGTFMRVRRSALVNVRAVVRLERYAKGMYVLRLRNGDKVISSRYHQRAIRSLLQAGA